MIKSEIFEGKCIILDGYGRIWQINLGADTQPEIRLIKELPRNMINYMMLPKLVAAAGLLS